LLRREEADMAFGQASFTDMEYAGRKKRTKRDEFLAMMDSVLPWEELLAIIEPHYFDGKRGRPPRGIEVMLRMYLLQTWYNLSDEGVEDAIYDSYAFRAFMDIDFSKEQAPDATTLCKFRHLMEEHGIGKMIFDSIVTFLEENGRMMKGGTVIDATIIEAPPSTKNEARERDPEMHQAKKGNEWHFGMKAHIGVDAGTGYTHSLSTTAANVADIEETHRLIRDDDDAAWMDAGYVGIEKREEILGDEHLRNVTYHVNRRRSKITKDYPEGISRDFEKALEKKKSTVRSKVEHAFHVIKDVFNFRKVRYKGLKKNTDRLYMLFASSNIYMLGCAIKAEGRARLREQPLAQACA
jgi:IS5 family transposase